MQRAADSGRGPHREDAGKQPDAEGAAKPLDDVEQGAGVRGLRARDAVPKGRAPQSLR